jgi:predicted 3-demethylubiquinone-9 3-methyltransferase (glyoxalase superfamily)
MSTQKITPHLWFDNEATEAAEFYTAVFDNSRIRNVTTIYDTPSGDCDTVDFELCGQRFMSISAGPLFKFNPSVSFHVACRTKDEVDALWEKLIEGGTALMPLDSYPFSERYGWLQDKYGLSWQPIYVGEQEMRQQITPFLMFVGDLCGKAEQAINFYASVFEDGRVDKILRYGSGEEPDKEGTVKYADFMLFDMKFAAMDSAHPHDFAFNEAISFMVHCETQEELDDYWEKLSAVPASEQCGWLKDKYGLSWQIVPRAMDEMMGSGDKEKIARITQAFLKMKKLDIAALEKAYRNH